MGNTCIPVADSFQYLAKLIQYPKKYIYIFLNSPGWTSLVAQMVKRLSTMWETRVRALGQEDTLEKKMAIHSSAIAWKIPWTEEPGVHGVAKSWTRLSDLAAAAAADTCKVQPGLKTIAADLL